MRQTDIYSYYDDDYYGTPSLVIVQTYCSYYHVSMTR
jgi:hypothetical protein